MTDLQTLVEKLYDLPNCELGGPLHIVVDDYNVRDSDLDFCEGELSDHWAVERAQPEEAEQIRVVCRQIIEALRPLSKAQRMKELKGVGCSRN